MKALVRSALQKMAYNPFWSGFLNSSLLRAARGYRKQIYHHFKEQPPAGLVEKLRRDAVVLHGPFAGMRYPILPPGVSITCHKFLGTYENELHEAIETAIRRQPDVVVDIGCAEGFYVVGLAMRLPKARVVAFDINPGLQSLCQKFASANNVLDRVEIKGECTPEVLKALVSTAKRPLIISDCEGYEMSLFAPGNAEMLRNADVLVELHDYINPRIPVIVSREFEKTHDVTLVQGVDDFVKAFNDRTPELSELSYGQKFVMVAEQRGSVMTWGWYQSKLPH